MKYYIGGADELIGFDFYCDIANSIVKERKRMSLTQEALAQAAKLTLARISAIEAVKTRIHLDELKKIAEVFGVTVDFLIEAEFGCHGQECLYLVWNKDYPRVRLYQKATSSRMAVLFLYDAIKGQVRVEPRTRFCAKLVGIPVSKDDLLRMYPKRDQKQPYDDLEPDEG